ncbi:hypothetical protein JTB14_021830 [Gonioctena quinquepunctata]|nr:hypothetical protein JTB14_021830 [Gonioctena quinquepunctata]
MEEKLRKMTTNLHQVYTNDLVSDFTEECIHFQKQCAVGIDHPPDKSLEGISKFLMCNSLQFGHCCEDKFSCYELRGRTQFFLPQKSNDLSAN